MQAALFDLTGRAALVTGACGLGRAIALGLARHGAGVVVADRDLDRARETAEGVRAMNRPALALACDVSQEDEVRSTVAAAVATFGRLDILVNNAGIRKRLPLFDWQPADWEEVLRTNQVGTFLMAREAGRHMVVRGSGSIINVCPLTGAIHGSTRGAVTDLTRDLAAEWARRGVRVNAVAPGWLRTETEVPLVNEMSSGHERVALGRLGEPEDVVGPVVFLASDASAMITGHVLPVDGGVSAILRISDVGFVR